MTRQDIINTLKQGCPVTPRLVRAIIEQMEKDAYENKVLHMERNTARQRFDNAFRLLTGIHRLLYPAPTEFLDQADKILTITSKMEVHLRKFQPGVLLGDIEAIPMEKKGQV